MTEPLPDIPPQWRDYALAWLKRQSHGLPPWIDWEQLEIDVLVEVWESQRRYDPAKSRFTTFIAWVVRGAVTRHLRNTHPLCGAAYVRGVQCRTESLDAPMHDWTRRRLDELADETLPAPFAHEEAWDEIRNLWAAVDTLPGELPDLIRRRFLAQHSASEIAAETGVSKQTILNRQWAAMRMLRNRLPADLSDLCRP